MQVCFQTGFAGHGLKTHGFSRKGFCRNPRGFCPNKVLGEFCGGLFRGFFRAFFLGKTEGKNPPPKSTAKFKSEFGSFAATKNPHCKDLVLEGLSLSPESHDATWYSPGKLIVRCGEDTIGLVCIAACQSSRNGTAQAVPIRFKLKL